MKKQNVEDVFKTEGIPAFTFIEPPNYNDILMDIRNKTKPVIIEGQSGTGKTTVVKHILSSKLKQEFIYLTPRISEDLEKIQGIVKNPPVNKIIVIDDFHRLNDEIHKTITDRLKVSAESSIDQLVAKFIIIGINKLGAKLISFADDIAKRCGIHSIKTATHDGIMELISKGEKELNITIKEHEELFHESRGDYWLIQLLCQATCSSAGILETCDVLKTIQINFTLIREKIVSKLSNSYESAVIDFCRGTRFRPGNDPYFRLLQTFAMGDDSVVDLEQLAAINPEVKGSINNIKDSRLSTLLDNKPECKNLFYYTSKNRFFAVEDPALFYYLKNLDWKNFRKKCGFKENTTSYEFDFAVSFAGEQRNIAKQLTESLKALDCNVFYDELYEQNYLGNTLHNWFNEIFTCKSQFIICVIDKNYAEKIWTTFEKECYLPRVKDKVVVPIFVDNTQIPGIPKDLIGFNYSDKQLTADNIENECDDMAVKLESRLERDGDVS